MELLYAISLINVLSYFNQKMVPICIKCTELILIEKLPDNLYYIARYVFAILLLCSILSILSFILITCLSYPKFNTFLKFQTITITMSCCIPLIMSIYISLYYDTLSDKTIEYWDSLDTKFVENLKFNKMLILFTIFPSIIWAIFYKGYISNSTNLN